MITVPPPKTKKQLRRFHGTAKIDATLLSRDADQIASAVVQHLGKLVGATVTVTIEIEAEIPSGAPANVARIKFIQADQEFQEAFAHYPGPNARRQRKSASVDSLTSESSSR